VAKNKLFRIYLCVFLCVGPWARAVSNAVFQEWGRQSLAEIKSEFKISNQNLYGKTPTDKSPAYAWACGVLMSAMAEACKVDSSYISDTRAFFDTFHSNYHTGSRCGKGAQGGYNAGYRGCGDRYYDDNAWIALAQVELYMVCGDEKYLTWAKNTVAFSMSGENGPQNDPPGGIRWHESNTGGSSVCAAAPTTLANLMIYEITGETKYFQDGLRIYTWLATSGLHRLSDGVYHETNQGPLGYQTAVVTQCAIRLYNITGDPAYLAEAQRLGAAMEKRFIDRSSHRLKQTGKWGGHDMTNAYVDLYEADHNPHWLNLAAGCIEYVRNHGWDPVTGRYPTDWNSTTAAPSTDVLDQASACRALWRMASTPGGNAPVYVNLANRPSGRVLRPYAAYKVDNTHTVIYNTDSSNTSLLWTLTDLQNGYYGIRSWHSDTSLQPLNHQSANNTQAVIYATQAANPAQQWTLSDIGSGWFNIQNRLTGKSLQPLNASSAHNTTVVTVSPNPSVQAQQWRFNGLAVPTSITPSVSINGGPWVQTDRVYYNFGDAIGCRVQAPAEGTWTWSGPGGFAYTGSEFTGVNANPAHAGTYCVTFTNSSGVESYSGITIVPITGVTLFQNINYTGWAASFGPGAYRTSDLEAIGAEGNDASSVRIKPGYKVTFYDYDNFSGPSLVMTADDATLVNDGWNDRVGSMVVEEDETPIADWPMNQAVVPTLFDVSANQYDGACVNMQPSAWVHGKRCQALEFDGIDDFVRAGSFYGIEGGGSRTCTAWIKTARVNGGIITWGFPLTGEKWNFGVAGGGGLGLEVKDGYVCSTTPVADGKWHHVAAVLENDGTPDVSEVRLYVDGVRETPSVIVPQPIRTSGHGTVTLGSFGGTEFFFQGIIDEPRVYARALSDAEIRDLYEADALSADIETDGTVNLADLAALGRVWQSVHEGAADLTCDGQVDLYDLAILIDEWLGSI